MDENIYGPDAIATLLRSIADELDDDSVTEIHSLQEWQDYVREKIAYEVGE